MHLLYTYRERPSCRPIVGALLSLQVTGPETLESKYPAVQRGLYSLSAHDNTANPVGQIPAFLLTHSVHNMMVMKRTARLRTLANGPVPLPLHPTQHGTCPPKIETRR